MSMEEDPKKGRYFWPEVGLPKKFPFFVMGFIGWVGEKYRCFLHVEGTYLGESPSYFITIIIDSYFLCLKNLPDCLDIFIGTGCLLPVVIT